VPNLNYKPKNLLPSYLSQNSYITKVIAKINKKSAENQGCCSKNCSKKRSQKQQIFSKIFEENGIFQKPSNLTIFINFLAILMAESAKSI